MKLKFKQQDFQVQAVKAVVGCFAGQPLRANRFTPKRGRSLLQEARQADAGTLQTHTFEAEMLEEIGYRNAPIHLPDAQLLSNIQAVQYKNGLLQSRQLERPAGIKPGCNLTIEMETGTGKTYTYIRTMYELHRHYGWSKFIVVVPSIAIREGVFQSFQVTQEHFLELYGHKISPFIYNSGHPQAIESFASDNRISVMIINTQAFNASGADARRIYQELDQFGTRRPIDIIARANPILIIDEPQTVDGEKTLKNMQDFNPLFTLRYSATHKAAYNKVYRLDALDAYNRRLVKKIQVKGISLKGSTGTTGYVYLERLILSADKPPRAVVEFERRTTSGAVVRKRQKLQEGADLFELSGGMPAYKNQVLTQINGQQNKITVSGHDICPGDVLNGEEERVFRRIQIRETILSHLQKEKQLFEKGIKVLSLFFIDAVDKYRTYDEAGGPELGEYARLFEEEYNSVRSEFLALCQPEDNAPDGYFSYLSRDDASKVHNGYFAIDKRGKAVDPKVKRGSEESDDSAAYDLIMKDKERLLSFEEPTRFIFSHSALKEGWDNPNVFQICALKNAEGSSHTRRRQEVGRGMRLCVNRHGTRQDVEAVGEQVHEINKLTVIAPESYEAFAKGLQKEIAETLKDRPQKADVKHFAGKMLQHGTGEEYRLTEDDARELNKLLYKYNIINEDDKITPLGRELTEQHQLILPEHLVPFQEAVAQLLRAVYAGEAFRPEDERQTAILHTNQNFRKKEFQALWEKISLKTTYEVRFDTAKLVHDSKNKINAQLHIADQAYEIKTGAQEYGTKDQLQEGSLVKEESRQHLKLPGGASTNALYDVVGEMEAHTGLTRNTIVAILKAIKEEKFLLLRKNPEVFIAACSRLINEAKASLMINSIVYHKTGGRHEASAVFTGTKQALRSSGPLKKHVYDYLTTESKAEAAFAKALEASEKVVVYARLPSSFYIPTPVARYSPGWAIVLGQGNQRQLYFVAETKSPSSDLQAREIEQLKMHCASEHFKAISGQEVKFERVSSYEKMVSVIQSDGLG